ncbi:MAG: urease accessory protein UreF [Muribaculaceae bacterium]|nr:urease accessory protein UreF [Muribaculaceae bacterium]
MAEINDMTRVMRLLQFTDSQFPVGTFSFSNGLETASFEGIVKDAKSLKEFARSQSHQAAYSDGVACLHAYRAFMNGDLKRCMEIDSYLFRFKMNDEARLMAVRMGKKLAELGVKLYSNNFVKELLDSINKGETPGMYPVVQGIMFALAGVSEKDLFCSHQYGVINMVLGAALRCVKVSHYDTQQILEDLSEYIERLYNEASVMELSDMNAFYPQLDILASLHEKGNMRMFMN